MKLTHLTQTITPPVATSRRAARGFQVAAPTDTPLAPSCQQVAAAATDNPANDDNLSPVPATSTVQVTWCPQADERAPDWTVTTRGDGAVVGRIARQGTQLVDINDPSLCTKAVATHQVYNHPVTLLPPSTLADCGGTTTMYVCGVTGSPQPPTISPQIAIDSRRFDDGSETVWGPATARAWMPDSIEDGDVDPGAPGRMCGDPNTAQTPAAPIEVLLPFGMNYSLVPSYHSTTWGFWPIDLEPKPWVIAEGGTTSTQLPLATSSQLSVSGTSTPTLGSATASATSTAAPHHGLRHGEKAAVITVATLAGVAILIGGGLLLNRARLRRNRQNRVDTGIRLQNFRTAATQAES